MNWINKVFITLLFWPLLAIADMDQRNLRTVAEYHIKSSDLVVFSANGINVKLCSDCQVSNLKISEKLELFEKNSAIDLQRATELYVKKEYDIVYIGVNRETQTALYFRFGGNLGDQ